MIGKCSIFGGRDDEGMANDTGLALYEPHEANLRADLFQEANFNDTQEPTWKRLRTGAAYIALRFDKSPGRAALQSRPWKVTNPKNGKYVLAFLVDWGPHEKTGRLVDISPGMATVLGVETDDQLEVEEA